MSNVVTKESVKPLSFSSPDFDNEKYNQVAVAANLMELSLVKQRYDMKPDGFWEAEAEPHKLKQQFLGKPSGHRLHEDSGVLVGGYAWKAEIKFGRKKLLKLDAEYMLVYDGLETCDPEYAKLYFNKIARFTSYPYFRALFALSATNSSLALDPLPSLNDRVD
ncbi:hypothetical protein AB1A64_09210 [Ruegeria sp. ANG10]|uniref:hypothetical protein n=1 Tax=Ruegeria sp. ANG10 TaxID=3042467 RepID=UPI0034538894